MKHASWAQDLMLKHHHEGYCKNITCVLRVLVDIGKVYCLLSGMRDKLVSSHYTQEQMSSSSELGLYAWRKNDAMYFPLFNSLKLHLYVVCRCCRKRKDCVVLYKTIWRCGKVRLFTCNKTLSLVQLFVVGQCCWFLYLRVAEKGSLVLCLLQLFVAVLAKKNLRKVAH